MRARGVARITSRMRRVTSTNAYASAAMNPRRLRGFLLRLVRRRGPAIAVGVALAAPAVWVEVFGRHDAWWIDGLALVAGATGLAILWTAITGPSPDWLDEA
jgi:hypothetical protein